jgi:hypothetical protein
MFMPSDSQLRERMRSKGHTDGAEEFLGVPDLGKDLDESGLGSDVPSDLFLTGAVTW